MQLSSVLEDPATAVVRAEAFARDPRRLEVVRRTALLDAGVQDSLQRFARLAADLTGVPISAISLIDADRQYISGAYGIEIEQAPLDASYCKHTVADNIQLSVEDSLLDEVLSQNEGTRSFGIRSYLGSPIAAGGARVGALCVIDTQPRVWDAHQRRIIADLSAAAATDIELRLQVRATSQMADTDPLTGLGNRRALAASLDQVFVNRRSVYVGMFDLDGFKAYNDLFGHPAGDDLLVRLAVRLRDVCAPDDELFRMGGDEFCMLTQDRERLVLAKHAIADRGPGFTISSCLGVAEVPDDAADVTSAIAIADRRMYVEKRSLRSRDIDASVARVLQQALTERDRGLGGHSDNVSDLARDTALALGIDDDTVRSIKLAARLHDVGKMAISDEILTKPGALNEQEWQQMRCHTLIGERILAAAPALAHAAKLVRSSHERFDGGGYPDGLAGDEIPIGARIIFACDAVDAMTSDRSYRQGMPRSEAMAELARNAGTQFDPRVVAAVLEIDHHSRATRSPSARG